METPRQYKIAYTETAIQDMEEKADYISCQFRDPTLALQGRPPIHFPQRRGFV